MIFLYVTCKNEQEGKLIARALVEARAAACVNIHPVNSVWRDNEANSVVETEEVVLIIKTLQAKIPKAEAIIRQISSYQTPCIAQIPTEQINSDYEKWFNQAL